MMRFFDYLFYRMHIDYQKKGEGDVDVACPSMVVAVCIAVISSPIWFTLYKLLFGEGHYSKSEIYVIGIVFMIWAYVRYRKRKNEIIARYQFSPYNKKIHVLFIYFTIIPCFAVGVFLGVLVDKYIMEPYHLSGILGKWLGIL